MGVTAPVAAPQRVVISVAIMAVPERRQLVEQNLLPEVPNAMVIYDLQHAGVWPTARRAWQNWRQEATHHIVLQDDARPCKGFLAQVQAAIEAKPSALINFYNGYGNRHMHEQAEKRGWHWIRREYGLNGVAVCMPVDMIRHYLLWGARWLADDPWHDDNRMKLFQYIHHYPTWVTHPELVDHVGGTSSILGHNYATNYAAHFIEDARGVEIDWTQGADQERGYAGEMSSIAGWIQQNFKGEIKEA